MTHHRLLLGRLSPKTLGGYRLIRTLIAVTFFYLNFLGVAFAVPISVSVDRNPVSIDDSFQIQFTASETPDQDPDFSPLDQDFDIVSQNSGSNMSWVNGKASKTLQWTLTVMARQAGNLIIPPINFGKDVTQPLTIKVTPASAASRLNSEDDIILEVGAEPKEPYVQSQVLYTVRIYSKVEIVRAALNEPELDDAVIEKLGDDSHYGTRINGVDYAVTERKYALFPQKSGSVSIKPLVLNAEVLTGNRSGFNGFFGSQMTRNRRVTSDAVDLSVKPAPVTFSGEHWLSADHLVFSEEWSGDASSMKVGEPLTRTLTLVAKGTTVGQLPELNTAKAEDKIKQYPDQPVLEEQKKPDGLMASRQEKIALIPLNPGTYRLPAIEIPWFNTRSQSLEVAKIPEKTITVAAAADSKNQDSSSTFPKNAEAEGQSHMTTASAQTSDFWRWVSVALAGGWLATIVYFLRRQRSFSNMKIQAKTEEHDAVNWHERLKQACAGNDAETVKSVLLAWGKRQYRVTSLSALAPFCEAGLRDEILLLNRTLYSQEAKHWQGKRLFQAFLEHNAGKQSDKPREDSPLEPLFRL